MADRLCKNCSFWAVYPNSKSSGECRRYAPHPFYVAYYADTTKATSSGPFAPGTKADYWCGDFREKKRGIADRTNAERQRRYITKLKAVKEVEQ